MNTYFSFKTKAFFLCFLLLIVSVPYLLKAQNHPKVSITPAPAWHVSEYGGLHADISNKQVNTGYCFQLLQYDINVPEETSVIRIRKKNLASDGLQSCGNISLTFDPAYQKLKIHSINVIRDGESYNRLTDDSFNVIQQERSSESYIYDGNLTAFCILDDIRVGDEIEYCFSRIGRNPLEKGRYSSTYYFSYSEPIGEISYKLTLKDSDSLSIKQVNFNQQPVISNKESNVSYHWKLVDAAHSKRDSEGIFGYDPYKRVLVSTYKNWSEVADWAIPHYDTSIPENSELSDWVNQKQSEDLSDQEKMRTAISMVQEQVRYLGLEAGISAYKPHPVDEVFRNKYGDCKDKSLLLVSILNEFGFEAYPALVNTRERDSVASKLPSPMEFDHCIVVAHLRDNQIWIDPTMSTSCGPLERIPTPRYGKALVIKPNQASLVSVDVKPTDVIETTERFISHDFTTAVTLNITTIYTGYSASSIRNYFTSTIHEEISDTYLDFYASVYPGIELGKPFTFEDDSALNVVTVNEFYQVNDFWTNPDSSSDGSITCEFFPKTISGYLKSPSDLIRDSPYKLIHPQIVRHVIECDLHEDWNITETKNKIEGNGVKYNSRISIEGRKLSMVYNFKTTRDYVEAEEIASYNAKIDDIWNDLGYSLWYPGESEESVSYWLILICIITTIAASVGLWTIHTSFDPVSKSANPIASAFGGWLILPMIGITVSPFIMFFNLVSGGFFSNVAIDFISEGPNGPNFNHGLLIVFELITNTIFIVFSVFTAIQLYSKRTSAPKWIKAFYATSFLLIGTDLLLAGLIGIEFSAEDAKSVFRATFAAAIWIPYFIRSERVRLTFVKTLNPQQHEHSI
ncbi:MAG: DUF3857 domain-containing protein [Flavobacteriales bacterium]